MMTLQKVASVVLFLGILIFVHELGHFLLAKLLNVKVLRFAIGFGPRVFAFTRGETEYRLGWVPLGGYVKMAGEQPYEELSPEERERGFLTQPPWKRSLIVAAGPVFNLVFPVLVYFFVFLGPRDEVSARVGSVEPGLPAAAAKLQPGDYIRAVEGNPVRTFEDVRESLAGVYDREIALTVERGGETFVTRLTPSRTVESNPVEKVTRGMIGISPVARPPIVGVPAGSPAAAAGLSTFDRVLAVNGVAVKDEVAFRQAVSAASGPELRLKVARTTPVTAPGVPLQSSEVVELTLPRQEGGGYEALGAESADLYVPGVNPKSPAAAAGLQRGDKLLRLNGKPLASWLLLQLELRELEDRPFSLTWSSGGEEKQAELAQAKVELSDEFKQTSQSLELGFVQQTGLLEAGDVERVTLNRNVGEAFTEALEIVPEIIRQTALVIAKLFTGSVPFNQVGGPLMLMEIASKSAERGLDTYLSAMAVLSINLGLMNLLPIPVLDGFHLLSAFWEGVRRRPIPVKAREVANMVGLAMLALLMVMVLKNDISRLMR